MASHLHLYLPFSEDQLDPRPYPCIDPSPLFDEDDQTYGQLAAGCKFDAATLKKRRLDVFNVASPMHVLGRVTKRRLGPVSNATMRQPPVGIIDNPAPIQATSANSVLPVGIDAEVDAMLFKTHKITSKTRPPSWWYRLGVDLLKSIEPVNWTLARKAIDYHQSWCLQRLYGDMETVGLIPYSQKRSIVQEEWKKLQEGEKANWKYAASQNRSLFPLPLQDDELQGCRPLPVGVTASTISEGTKTTGMLLTWHGDWGMQDEKVQEAVTVCVTIEHLSRVLAGMCFYKELGDTFFQFCTSRSIKLGFSQVSVAVEHCLKGDVASRVHLHCYVSGGRHRLSHASFEILEFQDVRVSHVAFTGYGAKNKDTSEDKKSSAQCKFNSGRCNEAHYYLQFEKIGLLHQQSNHLKFIDFAVPARWIMNQYKQRKMTAETAASEIIGCRDRCRGSIAELEFQVAKQIELTNERKETAAKAQMKRAMRPFNKKPPAITEWLGQYDRPDEHMLFRFKPLVLDGETRFGKTSWALSFFGAESTLQVNCQNITAPNLLSWRRQCDQYSAILFDEGSWKLIFENKMLFQAGPASVDLGQSATNCNAYKVFVYAIPMIICSNDFWKDIDDAGRKYLASNIIYVPVFSPCYT
jgi:hypothetical protein